MQHTARQLRFHTTETAAHQAPQRSRQGQDTGIPEMYQTHPLHSAQMDSVEVAIIS